VSVVVHRGLTEPEYLELEERSEVRHEYLNGEVLAMAGGSDRHNRIAMNLGGALWTRLRTSRCFPVGSDQRHHVAATRLYTYPDLAVRCREGDGPAATRVVVEVLSASTEAWDRGGKFAHFQRDPDVVEYVLVSQRERRVEVFRRVDTARWELRVMQGDGELEIATLGVTVPLAEIYLGAAEESSDDEVDPYALG
jgi:Uma2 family endonuclease